MEGGETECGGSSGGGVSLASCSYFDGRLHDVDVRAFIDIPGLYIVSYRSAHSAESAKYTRVHMRALFLSYLTRQRSSHCIGSVAARCHISTRFKSAGASCYRRTAAPITRWKTLSDSICRKTYQVIGRVQRGYCVKVRRLVRTRGQVDGRRTHGAGATRRGRVRLAPDLSWLYFWTAAELRCNT